MFSLFKRAPQVDQAALVERLAAYEPDGQIGARLIEWLTTAPERELVRFNPRYLAEQIDTPLQRTLTLLSNALSAGLVELLWEVRCPGCGGQGHAFDSLSNAHRNQYCGGCKMNFDAKLDDEVRVTFSISPTVRKVAPSAADDAWRVQNDERLGFFSGHDLLTSQSFRELFVREPLPGGESFDVRRMTLLFTDLGGSTSIYARKGDPRAYGLVREHFVLLLQAVDQAGGAVVKTIGDAVMAVFPTGEAALKAAISGVQALQRFNEERQLGSDEALLLKVGLHSGPCLAVTLNDRLDYFGTTVNAAARVQKLAEANEIVFTAEMLQEIQHSALLEPFQVREEQVTLRGLESRPFTVYRFPVV